MNKELIEKTKEWMQLERKTLEQRMEADLYYEKNLMKLIEEDFITRNTAAVIEPVRHLVVSVGTSYEPIVLSIALFSPEKILFLYTEKSEPTLDKVVSYSGLKVSNYEKRKVSEIDPIDIYQEVKRAYLMWDKPERMYIDFTGGTKAMSAAAALAGAMIDVQMVYVASDDYLVDFRKPNPGSEKIVYLDNPLSVFGDMEVEKAEELYDEFNFSGAKEKLGVLKEMIPDPMARQSLNFTYLLSCAYEAWDALDFTNAHEYMKELTRQLKRDGRGYPGNVLVANIKLISEQETFLSELAKIPLMIKEKKQSSLLKDKEIIIPLMFTMWMNAKTREEQHKYDMATLLMYRLLEMIEQRRLAKYNLFVSDMDYDSFLINKARLPELEKMNGKERMEWLRAEVYSIRQGLFKGKISDYLPNPVSLLDGFVILSALRDPIVYKDDDTRLNVLKQMRSKVFLRNNSIFAHGLGPVPEDDYLKFRDFVCNMFEKLCHIEKIPYEKYTSLFSWLRIHAEED